MVSLSSEQPPSYVPDHAILYSSWSREDENREMHLIMENFDRGLGCKGNPVLIDDQESVRPVETALVPSSGKMTGYVYKRRRRSRNSVALITAQTSERAAVLGPAPDNGSLGKREVGKANGGLNLGSTAIAKHVPSSSVGVVELKDDLTAQTGVGLEVCGPAAVKGCLGRQEVDEEEDGNLNLGLLAVRKCGSSSLVDVVEVKDDCTAQTGEGVEVCRPTQENDSLGRQDIDNEGDGNFNLRSSAVGKHACYSSMEVIDLMDDNDSVKNWCASILMMHGLITRISKSSEVNLMHECVAIGKSNDGEPCKICGLSDSLDKLLICDSCDEVFHLSCCYPKIKRIPTEWWHCRHCKTKNRKAFAKFIGGDSETSAESENVGSDLISFMLRDTEPYTTQVRIGKDFQAEVPNWTGPVMDDLDNPFNGTALEALSEEHTSGRCNSDTSIGNWLQCQNVISHEVGQRKHGVMCGKWRRAPLFEFQTSDWECFSAILWDASHADCAVPQELSTEEVMKHLKFIESLKSRLAGKGKESQLSVLN